MHQWGKRSPDVLAKPNEQNVKEDKLPIHIILGALDFQRIRKTEPLVLEPNPDSDPGAEFTMLGWTLTGKTVGNGAKAEKGLFLNCTRDECEQMCLLEILGLSYEGGNDRQ